MSEDECDGCRYFVYDPKVKGWICVKQNDQGCTFGVVDEDYEEEDRLWPDVSLDVMQ